MANTAGSGIGALIGIARDARAGVVLTPGDVTLSPEVAVDVVGTASLGDDDDCQTRVNGSNHGLSVFVSVMECDFGRPTSDDFGHLESMILPFPSTISPDHCSRITPSFPQVSSASSFLVRVVSHRSRQGFPPNCLLHSRGLCAFPQRPGKTSFRVTYERPESRAVLRVFNIPRGSVQLGQSGVQVYPKSCQCLWRIQFRQRGQKVVDKAG